MTDTAVSGAVEGAETVGSVTGPVSETVDPVAGSVTGPVNGTVDTVTEPVADVTSRWSTP